MSSQDPDLVPGLRCLVVDDELALAQIIADYLRREGFTADIAAAGEPALKLAREQNPDVVILDLMLPGIDGFEICRQLRTFSNAYVIMLSAKGEEVDKLIGLGVGADDYLTKPFSPRELVARVKAMLRRPRKGSVAEAGAAAVAATPVHRFGSLEVDEAAREVRVNSKTVELTRTQFDLLAAMAAAPRQAFTRHQLIVKVWGADWYGDEHIVDVHLAQLRKRLGDDAANPAFIRTVRGVGYGMGPGK